MTLELERIQRNQKAALTAGAVRNVVQNMAEPQNHRNKLGENWTKLKTRGKTLNSQVGA